MKFFLAANLPALPATPHGGLFYATVAILIALTVLILSVACKNFFGIADNEIDRFRERHERDRNSHNKVTKKTKE
ncbi:MAG TPA: hypothetical protein VK742_20330 [Candidatus Sulfotelmatobacter sp.]|jgi:hypothetical protein|nr:hypothetical protein [Candidatus Sulfotelmatobacter sp.]